MIVLNDNPRHHSSVFIIATLLLVGLYGVLYSPMSFAAERIDVCVATDEWLPYVSWRDDQGGKLIKPVGITPDSIDLLFNKMKRQYTIRPIVWSRLSEATGNTHRNCDVIWDITASIAHNRQFLLSLPIYKMPITVVYNKQALPPNQLHKIELADLFKEPHSICGVRGFDYRELNALINVKVSNTQQAFDVLRHARCELFFMVSPVFDYGYKTGLYKLADNIAYEEIGDDYASFYFLAVTSSNDKARKLLKEINMSIANMQYDGLWEAIFAKYGVRSYLKSHPSHPAPVPASH